MASRRVIPVNIGTVAAPIAAAPAEEASRALPASEAVLDEASRALSLGEDVLSEASGGIVTFMPGGGGGDDGAALEVGSTLLSTYLIGAQLGRGGMAAVHAATHIAQGLGMAIKVPLPSFVRQAGAARALELVAKEAEGWINLPIHPHVVQCYYVRKIGDVPAIFMEVVRGGDLKSAVEGGALYEPEEGAVARLLDVLAQAAWGLHHAHQNGLVHRDVKASNVLLTEAGEAKLTDFGVAGGARAAGEEEAVVDSGLALDGTVVATRGGYTPAYAAPEQLGGRGAAVTHRTDMWGWGLLALELFLGRREWRRGDDAPAVLGRCESGELEPRAPMPPSLARLLARCFEADAAKRPRDMAVIADAVRAAYKEATGEEMARRAPRAAMFLADSYNNRGVSLLDLGGREEEAIACWEKALAADKHHLDATFNLMVVRWRRGEATDTDVLARLDELAEAAAAAGPAAVRRLAMRRAEVAVEAGDEEGARAALEAAAGGGGEDEDGWVAENVAAMEGAGAAAAGWVGRGWGAVGVRG